MYSWAGLRVSLAIPGQPAGSVYALILRSCWHFIKQPNALCPPPHLLRRLARVLPPLLPSSSLISVVHGAVPTPARRRQCCLVWPTGNSRPLCFHGAWPERGQCIHEARQHGRRHHGAMDDRLLAPVCSSAGHQTTYPGYVPDLAILVPGGRPAIHK